MSLYIRGLFCFHAFVGIAFAEFIDLSQLERPAQREVDLAASALHVAPHETNPYKLSRLLNNAPSGVYITVGTERGFMGAALSSNTTHLLLLDRDPSVVIFNKINTYLLTMAKNRSDYVDLRLKVGQKQWNERVEASELSEQQKQFMKNSFDFWKNWARDNPQMESFNRPVSENANENTPYYKANYLFVDDLFERLQKLAKDGKIQSEYAEVDNTKNIELIVDQLKKAQIKLSALDWSNLTNGSYIQPKEGAEIMGLFRPIQHTDSTLIVTERHATDMLRFMYGAYPMRNFNRAGAALKLLTRLAEEGHLSCDRHYRLFSLEE